MFTVCKNGVWKMWSTTVFVGGGLCCVFGMCTVLIIGICAQDLYETAGKGWTVGIDWIDDLLIQGTNELYSIFNYAAQWT